MFRYLLYAGLFLLSGIFFQACIPPQEEDPGEIKPDFKQDSLRQVINLADKQVKDSLLVFIRHKSPTTRYYALKGLAAMKDSSTIEAVALLLNDPLPQIRSLAAYTLGLTGSKSAVKFLTQAFANSDTVSARQPVNEWILEALGRCGDRQVLQNLTTVRTYLPTDTALVNGRSKAIFRFALRGITSDQGSRLMYKIATDNRYPPIARLYSLAYLARVKDLHFDIPETQKLIKSFAKASANEKVFLAKALQKSTDTTSFALLKSLYSTENNPAIKAELLRTISSMPYEKIKFFLFDALRYPNPQVQMVAADALIRHGKAYDATEYYKLAKDPELNERQKVALLSAGLKHISRLDTTGLRLINRTLRNIYITSTNPYTKVAVLKGLAEFPWNFRFIRRESSGSGHKVVQVGGIEALDQLLRSPNYTKSIGSYRTGLKHELARFFLEAIASDDPGKRTAAAIALRNDDPEFRSYILRDTAHINTIGRATEIATTNIESKNEILKTLALLTGTDFRPIRPTNEHSIDWTQLESLSEVPVVTIATSKGNIKIILFPLESPATVANFIKEAKHKYYNNKTFHRVVPAFVIQGGGPRGDGYGAPDYTLRTELFPYNYDDAGYVGLASAGNHTEGVQFFITHVPTPHLDGNYTIFGKVIGGMDVVHNIEVGDKILTITIEE